MAAVSSCSSVRPDGVGVGLAAAVAGAPVAEPVRWVADQAKKAAITASTSRRTSTWVGRRDALPAGASPAAGSSGGGVSSPSSSGQGGELTLTAERRGAALTQSSGTGSAENRRPTAGGCGDSGRAGAGGGIGVLTSGSPATFAESSAGAQVRPGSPVLPAASPSSSSVSNARRGLPGSLLLIWSSCRVWGCDPAEFSADGRVRRIAGRALGDDGSSWPNEENAGATGSG